MFHMRTFLEHYWNILILKYENILIIGDLNTDTSNKKKIMVTIYPIYVMHSRWKIW